MKKALVTGLLVLMASPAFAAAVKDGQRFSCTPDEGGPYDLYFSFTDKEASIMFKGGFGLPCLDLTTQEGADESYSCHTDERRLDIVPSEENGRLQLSVTDTLTNATLISVAKDQGHSPVSHATCKLAQ